MPPAVCGKASGARDLVPEWARSFSTSSDMVKLTEVNETVRSVGFVGMITYPYSPARHDVACEIFDRGRPWAREASRRNF